MEMHDYHERKYSTYNYCIGHNAKPAGDLTTL